jgi:5'-nucleotidase
MIILVDMDDVLADFDSEFLNRWRAKYPDKFYVPLEKRSLFYMKDQYPPDVWKLVRDVYTSPGFIRSLPVVPGGIEAVNELSKHGFDVFICSSPLSHYENCVLEKYEWVDEHLGREWIKRLIIKVKYL